MSQRLACALVLLIAFAATASVDARPVHDDVVQQTVEDLRSAGFLHDRLEMLRVFVAEYHMYCKQIIMLLEAFPFQADRLKALEILGRPDRILDLHHRDTIVETFRFGRDQARAREYLGMGDG